MKLLRNTLHHAVNLQVLRAHVPDDPVGLVYLNPPHPATQGFCCGSLALWYNPGYTLKHEDRNFDP